jgi:mannose-1-phosphate guanylyltransferase
VIAVVLVGGAGTRLRPLTDDRPKPMLPVAGRPFLAHLLDRVAAAGVDRVIFSCGYLPDAIVAAFGDEYAGVRLEYAVEPEPMDTAGAIRFAAYDRVEGPFLALNGDILAESSLADLTAFHRAEGARATLTLTAVTDPSRYGLVLTDADANVTAFLEKPAEPGPPPYWINAGAYVLEPSVFELIPAGRRVNIEREVFPRLVGHGLVGWQSAGYWNDIGTPASYLAANLHLIGGRCLVGDGARVDPLATVTRSVIGAGAVIEPEATVEDSVVHEDAVIGRGATVRRAIVGRGARVAGDATVDPEGVVAPGEVARGA